MSFKGNFFFCLTVPPDKRRTHRTPNLNFVRAELSGLSKTNAKSQRFSYAISQIAALPPVAAPNRSSKSQLAARYATFWHAISQIALASFL